jgi:hypothetical protein
VHAAAPVISLGHAVASGTEVDFNGLVWKIGQMSTTEYPYRFR